MNLRHETAGPSRRSRSRSREYSQYRRSPRLRLRSVNSNREDRNRELRSPNGSRSRSKSIILDSYQRKKASRPLDLRCHSGVEHEQHLSFNESSSDDEHEQRLRDSANRRLRNTSGEHERRFYCGDEYRVGRGYDDEQERRISSTHGRYRRHDYDDELEQRHNVELRNSKRFRDWGDGGVRDHVLESHGFDRSNNECIRVRSRSPNASRENLGNINSNAVLNQFIEALKHVSHLTVSCPAMNTTKISEGRKEHVSEKEKHVLQLNSSKKKKNADNKDKYLLTVKNGSMLMRSVETLWNQQYQKHMS
ncbi:hypothetical protein ACJJTC_008769 [Scirpophaga incertulas]